jgi:pimeloyl-ACP methyl ester carboxylesterase
LSDIALSSRSEDSDLTERLIEQAVSDGVGAKGHLVILVHGINTRALWMGDVKAALESSGFTAAPTSYGQFGIWRFLAPFRCLRNKAIEHVADDIRTARRTYNMTNGSDPKRMSVISHSFGTYVVGRLLTDYPDFKWDRIIFCGSVVREDFPLRQVLERFTQPLLNEIGTKDFWPALAESVGWGYGSVGSTGFNRPPVETRWHHGYRHSNFLTEKFCNEFWIPFLQGDKPKRADKPTEMPLLVRLTCMLPLRFIIVALPFAIIFLVAQGIANNERLSRILPWKAQDEAVNTILSGCYRRALFTQTQRELDIRAMFDSIDKCRIIVQTQSPHIRRKESQGEATELLAVLTGIEALRSRTLATEPINKLKLVALESFRKLAEGTTGVSYSLPVKGKLSGTIFGLDLNAANDPLNSEDLNNQVAIDPTTGAVRY